MSDRRVRWGERKRQARQAIALTAVLLMGCGGDQGPAPVEVAGAWSGTLTSGGTANAIAFTITETAGAIAGSGSLGSSSQAVAVQIGGTWSEPNASLVLTADGFNPINCQVVVTATTLQGTANGSGFVSAPVSMIRQ